MGWGREGHGSEGEEKGRTSTIEALFLSRTLKKNKLWGGIVDRDERNREEESSSASLLKVRAALDLNRFSAHLSL